MQAMLNKIRDYKNEIYFEHLQTHIIMLWTSLFTPINVYVFVVAVQTLTKMEVTHHDKAECNLPVMYYGIWVDFIKPYWWCELILIFEILYLFMVDRLSLNTVFLLNFDELHAHSPDTGVNSYILCMKYLLGDASNENILKQKNIAQIIKKFADRDIRYYMNTDNSREGKWQFTSTMMIFDGLTWVIAAFPLLAAIFLFIVLTVVCSCAKICIFFYTNVFTQYILAFSVIVSVLLFFISFVTFLIMIVMKKFYGY